MKRRDFLASSAIAGLAVSATSLARSAETGGIRQLVELRVYRFASREKRDAFDEFLATQMIPALNQMGIKPVGVFSAFEGDLQKARLRPDETNFYVMLPHRSPESFVNLAEQLAGNASFQSAGKAVLDAPRSAPAYVSCETSLVLSFEGLPKVEAPIKAETRLMQLRVYQAHNDAKAALKVRMFSQGGILSLFRRNGLQPVFGGQTLSGACYPSTTYMLEFADRASKDKAWAAFWKDQDWVKLWKQNPQYKDTDPINVINLVLRPAKSSQV